MGPTWWSSQLGRMSEGLRKCNGFLKLVSFAHKLEDQAIA
jgi:hypothetical protein